MNRLIILALYLWIAAKPDAVLGEELELPDRPEDYARVVIPQLPPGWRCMYDFRTLVIAHDEQVTFLNRVSLPPGERNEAFFKKFGFRGPYLIVMRFVSRLSGPDQRALADRRQQAVDAARRGREREKYTGDDVYFQHFVPEYFNHRFSIDLQVSDSSPLQLVAPADVVKQRDAILTLLHTNLRAYPAQQ